jgi:hypothetical protein
MSNVNAEEIKLVIKDLEVDLRRWNQGHWCDGEGTGELIDLSHDYDVNIIDTNHCGTTFCVAGMACLRAGYKMSSEYAFDSDGNYEGSIETVASAILGLNESQVEAIFYSDDDITMPEMKALITEQTGVTFDD